MSINNDMAKMWKEASWPSLRYYLKGMRENNIRTVSHSRSKLGTSQI
jgi:hypothetical protein